MDIPFYQVDAFTSGALAGNPAAVMPLLEWLADDVLQAIAAENNLSETAYFVGGDGQYQLRWFTPTTEVNLCGHATLASAYILFQHLAETAQTLRFDTRSGALTVSRRGELLVMDFPVIELEKVRKPTEAVLRGLGARPDELLLDSRDRNYYAVFNNQQAVAELAPDVAALSELGYGVVATAPGTEADCVSRYFAPAFGIPEDPVTGSIHCALVPFWARRLNRDDILAEQISARGGRLQCRQRDDRVEIAGQAQLMISGNFHLPDTWQN